MSALELADREVAVFYAQPDRPRAAEAVDALLAVLSDDERERYRRFRFDRHRTEYLVAHALLRQTLGRYLGCAPAELEFDVAEHGKPLLRTAGAGRRLAFNLSHTDGLVACAVTSGADVGVDVEHEDRRLDVWELSRSVFSSEEQRRLRELSEGDVRRRFFDYWTLKEAYIKAVGKGLSLPLRSITFWVDGAEPSVAFEPPLEDSPAEWRFALLRVSDRHPLAVAVRAREPVAVRVAASLL